MELFHAAQQWSSRPADERFDSLQSLYNATKSYAQTAQEKSVRVCDIRTEAIDGDVQLVGRQNNPAKLTHWSFSQLAGKVNAPANYLRELPATLAAQNINHGLAKMADRNATAQLLFHSNGSLLLRAMTSDMYKRIWNYEIAERLLALEKKGWQPATPDKRFDGGNPSECQVCNGTGLANGLHCVTCKATGKALPSLYASDHDMFAFVRNNSVVIREPGNPDGLQRGVIVSNSEVGAAALKLTRFLYREMCGNHIIWGASKMLQVSVWHIGDARGKWGHYEGEIRRYAEQGAKEDEEMVAKARRVKIGDTKEEVLDKLFGMKSVSLSRKTLESGYDAAVPDQDGAPNTVWGIVQGLTRFSQTTPYAETRAAIDTAAGKLMEANF